MPWDKGLEIFFNWQTVVIMLSVYFATYVVRTVVEALIVSVRAPGTIAYHLWNELFLHVMPFGVGLLLALVAKSFPWPEPIKDARSAQLMVGFICGGGSAWFYGRLRAYLRVKAALQTDSKPPADAPKDNETV
jgi:hypothetical protein